jgi:hypothetical protein
MNSVKLEVFMPIIFVNSITKYHLLIYFLFLIGSQSIAQQKSIGNFPPIQINESNCPSEGYFFISSNELVSSGDSNFIAIIDNYGTPVFFKTIPKKVTNFKLQPNGYLSYSTIEPKAIYVLDSSYNYRDTITSVGYELNSTDFILTENNETVLLAFENRTFDMSTLVAGGKTNATIKESVIQILNENNQVVFSWKSSDHFAIMDVNTESPFVDLTSSEIDYISLSDIEIDSDSTLLISCKHMDEITRINRNTGQIIWRLGGKKNQFTFINDEMRFSHPTSVQKLPNGNFLIFDSGVLHQNQVSSIVEYSINEATKTATLIRRDAERKKIVANEFGNVQSLNNGNKLISWGAKKPSLTELNPNGTIALELDFSDYTYSRAITKADWKTNIFKPVVDSINFGMWDYTVFRYILILKNNSNEIVNITGLSNFTEAFYTEQSLPFQIPANGTKNLMICYYPEFLETSIITDVLTIISDSPEKRFAQQVKLIGYRDDFKPPTLSIYPTNGATNISIDTTLYFKFNEPVRFENGTEITYQNVSSLIVLKENDINGSDVEFDAAISSNKDKISVVPRSLMTNSQTYYFALNGVVEDYYNNSLLSDKTSLFTTMTPSKIANEIEPKIEIFPNPTNDFIVINSQSMPICEIKLSNISGQLVFNKKYSTPNFITLNLFNYHKGLYIIHIKLANGKVESKKIILQ